MSIFFNKKNVLVSACAFLAFASGTAGAVVTLSTPSGPVRLQDYSDHVGVWFTGSQCTYGGLRLDPTETSERNKQLLATVLAAKSMNATLFFEYDVINSQCIIRTFSVDGP